MRHPAQAGLNAAQNDRHIAKPAPDQIPVYDRRMIGPPAGMPTRRIGVALPPPAGHIIMIHHGIHISGTDQKRQPRPAENRNALRILPVRLCDYADPVAVSFQQSRDNRMAKRRMIDIGIARYIDKVHIVPSPRFHIRF